jgi:hypothetical protein
MKRKENFCNLVANYLSTEKGVGKGELSAEMICKFSQ